MRKLIPGAVEERVSRCEVDESDWYTCGCCATMETEVEYYCCGEICETMIHEQENSVSF